MSKPRRPGMNRPHRDGLVRHKGLTLTEFVAAAIRERDRLRVPRQERPAVGLDTRPPDVLDTPYLNVVP
jgi:hypothetical protein